MSDGQGRNDDEQDRLRRAATFLELHHGEEPLVLPNVWDAGSARIIEQVGFNAQATTSAGIAFSHGVADGALDRGAMVARIAEIVGATSLPVSADIESGYGPEPSDVAHTVAQVLSAGVVGVNLEDARSDGGGLFEVEQAAARIAAARAVAPRGDLVLNARTDTYLSGVIDPFTETLRRAEVFVEAGADCIFVPGVDDLDTIAALADHIPAPLNVVAGLTGTPPTVAELGQRGVARISVGGSLARAALGFVERAVQDLRDNGSFAFTSAALAHGDVQRRFAD